MLQQTSNEAGSSTNTALGTKANRTLVNAAQAVGQDRASEHGPFDVQMRQAAIFISEYLGHAINPSDVCIIQILIKLSRVKHGNYNEDDYTDIAGYAAIANELTEKESHMREMLVQAAAPSQAPSRNQGL